MKALTFSIPTEAVSWSGSFCQPKQNFGCVCVVTSTLYFYTFLRNFVLLFRDCVTSLCCRHQFINSSSAVLRNRTVYQGLSHRSNVSALVCRCSVNVENVYQTTLFAQNDSISVSLLSDGLRGDSCSIFRYSLYISLRLMHCESSFEGGSLTNITA